MEASRWVKRFAPLVQNNSHVLDLACGAGRHGRLFLSKSCTVHFVDKDTSGVSDLKNLEKAQIDQRDLEDGSTWPFPDHAYDAIIVTNYLYRAHLDDLIHSLKPGGILIYETFAMGNEQFGRPKSPDFLLKEGELLALVQGRLSVIAFEQGHIDNKVVQRICAAHKINTDDFYDLNP